MDECDDLTLLNGPDCEEKLDYITKEIEEIINLDPKELKEAFDSYDPDCQDDAKEIHTTFFKKNKTINCNCNCYLCNITEKRYLWIPKEINTNTKEINTNTEEINTNRFCILSCSEKVHFRNENGEEKIVKKGDVIQLIPTETYIYENPTETYIDENTNILIKDTDRFFIYSPKEFIKKISEEISKETKTNNNLNESSFIYMSIYFSMFEDLFDHRQILLRGYECV